MVYSDRLEHIAQNARLRVEEEGDISRDQGSGTVKRRAPYVAWSGSSDAPSVPCRGMSKIIDMADS